MVGTALGSLSKGVCFVLRFLLNTLRQLLKVGLWVLFFGFLILFILQLPHPPKWDAWGWVGMLQKLGKPVLDEIDSVLEWPAARPYYPFALAILCSFAQFLSDTYLRRVIHFLRRSDSRQGATLARSA